MEVCEIDQIDKSNTNPIISKDADKVGVRSNATEAESKQENDGDKSEMLVDTVATTAMASTATIQLSASPTQAAPSQANSSTDEAIINDTSANSDKSPSTALPEPTSPSKDAVLSKITNPTDSPTAFKSFRPRQEGETKAASSSDDSDQRQDTHESPKSPIDASKGVPTRPSKTTSSITIIYAAKNKSASEVQSPESINLRVSPTRQFNVENKSQDSTSQTNTLQKRNIILKSSPVSGKQSAGVQVLRQQPNSNIVQDKKAIKTKLNDSDLVDDYCYDSNEEYQPNKSFAEISDSSEDDTDYANRRETRLIKKLKLTNDEEAVTPKTDSRDETASQVKSTARKSTSRPVFSQTISPQQPQITQVARSNGLPSSTSPLKAPAATTTVKQAQLIVNTNYASNLVNKSLTTSSQQTSTAASNGQPGAKQFRNKIVLCKPNLQTKATQCLPITQDASTQVSLDDIQLTQTIVPVPVPINVPMPICMYQAPMPVPIMIPIPVPVPVFIPTTKRTFDRVERRIKKLRKKLPSDPYEFEILMYAEKLAREEGIAGFEESSDGESEPEQVETTTNLKRKYRNHELIKGHHHESIGHSLNQTNTLSEEGPFKWFYGVKIFNTWLSNKTELLRMTSHTRLPDDLLKLKNDELNVLLAEFVQEIRKPTGESYAPESVYYLCLGIQHYLQEKGMRTENIFLDYYLFNKFQTSFNEIALRYQIRINSEGHIVSRIEEEILWESKQLGAYSPFVLLNTILYFNTKHFFLDKSESHMKLSFTNVKKHTKRNIGPNNEDFGKTVYLRYYPAFQGVEQVIYEQGENFDNPLRCPVALYNFYLSKCPENVKNRSDVFYLLPERTSLPTSPVWFSNQPLGEDMLERMLNRIKMVKEVNELLVAASPNPLTHLV